MGCRLWVMVCVGGEEVSGRKVRGSVGGVNLIRRHFVSLCEWSLPSFASLSPATANERHKTAHHITMVIREWEGGVISIVDSMLHTQLRTLKIAAALNQSLGKTSLRTLYMVLYVVSVINIPGSLWWLPKLARCFSAWFMRRKKRVTHSGLFRGSTRGWWGAGQWESFVEWT